MHSAAEEYQRLEQKRDQVLKRARDCAELTIPALMPPEGHNEGQDLHTPHQGFGARGVNNLASKLLLALMPPNQTFYKFQVEPSVQRELESRADGALDDIEQQLSQIEQQILAAIESSADRTTVFEAIRHLIVAGNALLYMPNDGGMSMYRLDQYVLRRDKMGNVLEVVIKETVARMTLDEQARSLADGEGPTGEKDDDEDVDVYTRIKRDADQWSIHQEINEQKVPGSDGAYPLDRPGFIPLRWTAVANEDYGRSLVYEYIGDIRTLEGLSQSINEFAANASKIIWLVEPGGMTDPAELNEAESGEYVTGREQDISTLGLDKYPDFRMVSERIQRIESRLEQSFLLTASVQRDAERVTATEVRVMARELEDALGGVYSVQSQEFQGPYIKRKIAQLQANETIPSFPEDAVEPRVTTGLEALGRGHDLNKLTGLLADIAQLPPELAQQVLSNFDTRNLTQRLTTAHGIDVHGLVKSQRQVANEQRQRTAQQITEDAAPGVAQEAVKQMGQQPQQSKE